MAAVLIACLLFSCATPALSTRRKLSEFRHMEWLLGNWMARSASYLYSETWKKTNDTVYSGCSLMLMGNDTVLKNLMTIEAGKFQISLYEKSGLDPAAVQNQYLMTKNKEGRLIFENRGTGEISRIMYYLREPEVLGVQVTGSGKPQESYNLRKMKR